MVFVDFRATTKVLYTNVLNSIMNCRSSQNFFHYYLKALLTVILFFSALKLSWYVVGTLDYNLAMQAQFRQLPNIIPHQYF